MAEQVKTTTVAPQDEVLRVKAKEGLSFPLFYSGQIIWIGSEKAVELEVKKLVYEADLQVRRALKSGELVQEK